MHVNADFTKRVLVKFDENDWVPSPMPGVERKMLDRIGDEVARATTIVRFTPGSAFSAHTHDGGEEYLVLDGIFQDELGDFPEGTYVRNPPTSRHTPATEPGATILVKLHQFDPDDRQAVRIDTSKAEGRLALFEDDHENVSIHTLAEGEALQVDGSKGLEIFVLDGSLDLGTETMTKWDWLREPPGTDFAATAGSGGVRAWIKTGHLAPPRLPT